MAKAKKLAGNGNGGANESNPVESAATAAEKPAAKKVAKPRGRPRRAARRAKPAARSSAELRKAARRKRRLGRRHTPAERRHILATARREGLSGPKAAKRFGISTLTFYTWRKNAGSGERRGPKRRGRPRAARQGLPPESVGNLVEMIRREVRAEIGRLAPHIIESEIGRAFSPSAGRRKGLRAPNRMRA